MKCSRVSIFLFHYYYWGFFFTMKAEGAALIGDRAVGCCSADTLWRSSHRNNSTRYPTADGSSPPTHSTTPPRQTVPARDEKHPPNVRRWSQRRERDNKQPGRADYFFNVCLFFLASALDGSQWIVRVTSTGRQARAVPLRTGCDEEWI